MEGQDGHRIVGKGANLETDQENSTANNTGEVAGAKHTGCIEQGKV